MPAISHSKGQYRLRVAKTYLFQEIRSARAVRWSSELPGTINSTIIVLSLPLTASRSPQQSQFFGNPPNAECHCDGDGQLNTFLSQTSQVRRQRVGGPRP